MDEFSFAALALLSFVAVALCAVTGFGENIVFQIGWYCFSLLGLCSGNMTESVAVLTIISWPLLATQAYLQRKNVNWRLAMLLAVSGSASSLLGVAILVRCDNVWLKRSLGFLLMVVFCWRVSMEWRFPPPAGMSRFVFSGPRECALATVTGIASGFLGGLFSTAGPPSMIFVLVARVGKEEWRSTQAVTNTITLPIRFAALMSISTLDRHTLQSESCVCLVAGFIGLLLGNHVAPRVSEENFRGLILLFLLCGGITLASAGTGALTSWLLMATCGAALVRTLVNRMYWATKVDVDTKSLLPGRQS